MEKEDEGVAEEEVGGDEVDVKGEPGGPMDTVMAQAQGPVLQPIQQTDKVQDVEMLSDVTDLSSPPMVL